LTERQASEALGVSIDTLQRLRKRRAIRYRKIGGRFRYTEEDLAAYIESTVQPCLSEASDPEKSAAIGSAGGPTAAPGAGLGTTPKPRADRRAEYLSAQTILSRPSSGSRRG
jgi:excisionase family DNA binding protein